MPILAACSTSTQPAPQATIAAAALPADWQRIQQPQFSLALPPEWTVTSAEEMNVADAVNEMAAQNPQLKAVLEQGRAALISGQVQLLAFDLNPERIDISGFPTNIRIGRQTVANPAVLEQVADVNEQDLRNTPGFSEVKRTPVLVSGVPATRLTSQLQVNDTAGQPLTLAVEQYLLVDNKEVFVITLTTPHAQQEAYRTTFDQILATLRLK
jgi:hypothetical protein